jgi:siroheme synthase-like protein
VAVEGYPVVLRLTGRPCLVVGGGRVAAGKAAGLLAGGARVTVVAPEVVPAVEALDVVVERRPYERGLAARFRLVVTATGVPEVDRAVAEDAERAGVWVNSADDPDNCSFVLPAVHRDGPVSIAVSTGGASPALAVWLRGRLGEAAGPGVGQLAELLEEARLRVRADGRATGSIDWAALLDGELPDLVRSGDLGAARDLLARATA